MKHRFAVPLVQLFHARSICKMGCRPALPPMAAPNASKYFFVPPLCGGMEITMPENSENQKPHGVLIRSREHLELTAVTDVISFDEDSVNLETSMGEMLIEGEGLKVGTLDTAKGVVIISGRINGLYYRTEQPGRRGIRGLIGK